MDYYHISAEELGQGAKIRLEFPGDSPAVFFEMAQDMVRTIREHNAAGAKTVFICPVGPVGQYPYFVKMVNDERLSLKDCWFINMDEYLTDDDEWIDASDGLSFRGFMDRVVYSQIDPELVMPPEQRIFPDPKDPGHVARGHRVAGRCRRRLWRHWHHRPPRLQRAAGGPHCRAVRGPRDPRPRHSPRDPRHQQRGRPLRSSGGHALPCRYHWHGGDPRRSQGAPRGLSRVAPRCRAPVPPTARSRRRSPRPSCRITPMRSST